MREAEGLAGGDDRSCLGSASWGGGCSGVRWRPGGRGAAWFWGGEGMPGRGLEVEAGGRAAGRWGTGRCGAVRAQGLGPVGVRGVGAQGSGQGWVLARVELQGAELACPYP